MAWRWCCPRTPRPAHSRFPRRLRYQACDDKTCFTPRTIATVWSVRIDRGRRIGHESGCLCAHRVRYRHAHAAAAPPPALTPVRPGGLPDRAAHVLSRALASAINSRSLAPPAATSTRASSSRSSETQSPASSQKGLFEGRGPLAILLLVFLGGLALNLTPCVLPMIPDQPRDHRRGRAGRLARARLPAGRRLRRGHGAGLRRARAGRDSDGRHVRHASTRRRGSTSASRCCSSCSALAMFDVFDHRLLAVLEPHPLRRGEPGHVRAGVRHGRAWPRCWPAPAWRRSSSRWCCSRATSTRRATTLALALPFVLGLGMALAVAASRAPASPALPKPGAGWFASSRSSASSSSATARLLRLPGVRACSRTGGSIAGAVARAWRSS